VPERKATDKYKGDEGDTAEYKNFQKVLEQALSVPKEEIDRRRAEYERKRKKQRAG
jgi:hypothetical protein